MKELYIECRMGAAGDMLNAALSELVDQQAYLDKMNSIGLEGITFKAEPSVKCGIHGTHMSVVIDGEEETTEDVHMHEHHHDHEHEHEHHHDHDHDHEHEHDHDHGHHHHHHSSMQDITAIINGLNVSDKVKKDAIAVYGLIAEAESAAHNTTVDQIHFHEVGSKDAVADVVGVCVLMEMIGAERVYVSPVNTGYGMVRCAHGILPVPAPATAYLLKGVPSYAGRFEGELCTPTGAALLKYFADSFENMPVMKTEKVGYGMGKKDFPAANAVRAFLGEMEDDGEVLELVCNIDDESSEEIGFASEELMAAGALDVYVIAADMKKNRPGHLFTCMCRVDDREKMVSLMFRHLTTIGIREYTCRRHALKRSFRTVETEYGPVRIKRSEGYGTVREKTEFEDIAKIAKEQNMSLADVRKLLTEKEG